MNAECRGVRIDRSLRAWARAFLVLTLVALPAVAGEPGPTFSKIFLPDTIGPGGTTTLQFDIFNQVASPVTDLAFVDDLPAGVVIATPASAFTDCTDGILSAPDGGTSISLSDGQVGAGSACIVTVNVTSSTPGMHTNISGDLTSSAGNSGSATDDLMVVTSLPGFSKSFAPSTVPLGDRSTLTFTIDNSANPSNVLNLDFTDNLPVGMEIAGPANAATDCGTAVLPPTLIATAGSSLIILDANGTAAFPAVAADATCTVTADVVTTGSGDLDNISGELLADFVSAGKASATLDVTFTPLALQKSFTNDPVPSGGTVTLDFRIDNFDRDFAATGIGFTDDLAAALSGLTFSSLLANDCGGSVMGAGTTTITFSGGTAPAQGFCTISTSLTVPAGATPGAYTNTTGAVTGTVDGMPVTGNMASDVLFVEPVPVLTKLFVGDPVNVGDTVTLRFTIENTSATSMATDIEFVDELTDGSGGFPPDPTSGFLPFPVDVTLPPVPDPPCGAGSALALISVGQDRQGLELTGGSLDAAPGAGSSCTFEVTLTIPDTLAPGVYTNTTEEITATVDGATRIGNPASDDIIVIAAPQLTKAFTDDPAAPGGTVTLEFTLTHRPDAIGDATGVTFTDDLAALIPAIPGLVATGLPLADLCGPANGTLTGSAGDTLLTFMGGTLSPGQSCTFSVSLDVPVDAASGSYTNTTSGVAATVGGLAATSAPATDDLKVAGLTFTKEFVDDPVIPGDTVTLLFTIENVDPTDDASSITFSDDLAAVLPGTPDITSTGPPAVNTCGGSEGGSSTLLNYTGGSLAAGLTCTVEYEILVPAGADDGTYNNISSSLSAIQSGTLVFIDPATDSLTVFSSLLGLSKEFTDDPVAPGGTVTLEFSLTNFDVAQVASAIGFSDDLGAALTGLTFDSVLFDDCGGTVSGTGTDMITVSGISLAANSLCTLRVSLSVPSGAAANIYTNTTSEVTGTIGGLPVSGDAATDELSVIDLLQFSKAFDGPTIATGTPVLSFTITNPTSNTATAISFSDDLDAVISGLIATNLPLSDICGAGSLLSGTSFLTLTGGILPPNGGTCSFDVDLLVPGTASAGTFTNTTSDLFQGGLPVAEPATADLTVEPPPAFSKIFAPDSIGTGEDSTLTFTIDNTASSLSASGLDFTDNLPAPVVVGNPPNASASCSGGTVTAVAGTNLVTYTDGAVAAGASCTVQVDVTSIVVGTHVNTTGDLTSSSGNSGTATANLTVLDLIPPTVTNVDSVPDTGDGQVEDCETVQVPIRQILVSFSEPVQDPPGDIHPDDVTNPANYLLVGAGSDSDIQTTVCGPTMGDDVAISISSVTYDAGALTATLDLASGLPESLYRLLVCGSTSIRDLAGNALDGDNNGSGGDDYEQIFRSDPANLLTNGHFDCSLVDWIVSETIPGTVTHSTEDVDDSSLSGSAQISNPSPTGGSESFALAQCVPVQEQSLYNLGSRTRLEAAPGVFVSFIESCEFFDQTACGGSSLGVALSGVLLQDTGGMWISIVNGFDAPALSASALCMSQFDTPTGDAFEGYLDNTVLAERPLFADGFESGDTSAWSTTVP